MSNDDYPIRLTYRAHDFEIERINEQWYQFTIFHLSGVAYTTATSIDLEGGLLQVEGLIDNMYDVERAVLLISIDDIEAGR